MNSETFTNFANVPNINIGASTLVEPQPPTPLIADETRPAPFPVDALCLIGKEAALAAVEATQAPLALCASSVIASMSVIAQGIANTQVLETAMTGSVKPLSLYMATIALSGERKSSVDGMLTKAIDAHHKGMQIKYGEESAAYDDALKKLQKDLKKASSEEDETQCQNLRAELAKLHPPRRPTFLVTDATSQALIVALRDGSGSTGMFSDEGGIFLGGHSMKAEQRTETVSSLSKLWDGTRMDRFRILENEQMTMYNRRLSVHFLMQPIVADQLLNDPIAKGQGFLPRFLISQPDSRMGTRFEKGRELSPKSKDALQRWHAKTEDHLERPLEYLCDVDASDLDFSKQPAKDRGELDLRTLALPSDIREMLVDFHDEIEAKLGENGGRHKNRPLVSL